ncbi:MAG TPA: hypothetical protein VGG73_16395 [Vicinamibacterales bacterium]
MFQNAALDVAIGLVLMYVLLSLVCTVVNEFISSQLSLRSKSLASALREMLDDPDVRAAFYKQGLVASAICAVKRATPLMAPSTPSTPADADTTARASIAPGAAAPSSDSDHLSYLSTETFVLALFGTLIQPTTAQPRPGLSELETAIAALPDTKLKSALHASLISAQGDFEHFRTSVARWFDDSMDRLSGAYKRNLQFIAILVGCLLAVIVNADSLAVGRALWSDGALRAAIVQSADATAKAGLATNNPSAPSVSDVGAAFAKADNDLRPLPIGWPACQSHDAPGSAAAATSTTNGRTATSCPSDNTAWFWFALDKIFGLFATGLALSLGAPFWFDLLSKFVNIRAAGVKPERATAK